jgi:prepilin-type N-terminal cleavage/methylation domain-containing protein
LPIYRSDVLLKERAMKTRTPLGFSLLELMIVIIVGAILAALALPSFRTYFIRNNIATTANGLLAAMNTARAEAIKRNAYVRVDPTTCSTADWSYGAFVWVPSATNPLDTVPSSQTDPRMISGNIVADGSGCNSGQKLKVTVLSGAGNDVCYSGGGRVNVNDPSAACAAATTPLQVKICDRQTVVASGAILDVKVSGRASIEPNVSCP